MSTRRERAARAVADGIWPGPYAIDAEKVAESYRIADMVLAEVDRIPLLSELLFPQTDDGAVEPPATPGAVPHPAAQAGKASWRPAPSSPVTDGGAASPPADSPNAKPVAAGGEQAAERATTKVAPPSVLPRPFLLFRIRDVSGTSGTGVVAWGCEWPDKTASLRWATEHPSTVHWDSVEAILAVHGHQGATVIHWLNGGA